MAKLVRACVCMPCRVVPVYGSSYSPDFSVGLPFEGIETSSFLAKSRGAILCVTSAKYLPT